MAHKLISKITNPPREWFGTQLQHLDYAPSLMLWDGTKDEQSDPAVAGWGLALKPCHHLLPFPECHLIPSLLPGLLGCLVLFCFPVAVAWLRGQQTPASIAPFPTN